MDIGDARKLRVYSMASGEIAVPALASLLSSPAIEAVGFATQPDRPVGRRRVPTPTPVGQWCDANQINVSKPESVNDDDFLEHVQRCEPDVILVFAYGQLLKKPLLSMAALGCINIHASLLPRYRGASPVSAAILEGEQTTGVSFMQMERGLDSGPVFQQFEMPLSGTEYADELEEELGRLAAQHVCGVLVEIAQNNLTARPQTGGEVSYARKLTKANGQIDWTSPAKRIERQVRAYRPWPGAWFQLPGRRPRKITVTAATIHRANTQHTPGTVIKADKHGWQIACGIDVLDVERLVPEGKREMTGAEFIRGTRLEPGNTVTHEADCS